MLDRHLFTSSETVKAIKKANSLNHRGVSDHFRQTIDTLQKELSFNLTIVTNQATRDQLRINLNNLIGIKGKDTDTRASKLQAVSRGRPYSPPIPVNDKLFEKTSSFRIETQNYFRGEPFLHFFEVEENAIHIAKIADIEETGTVEWLKFPLQINFKVPSFHRSVATEQGHIFVIGGTRTESLSKSKTIYQYNP